LRSISIVSWGWRRFGARLFASGLAERVGAPITVAIGGVVFVAGGGVFALHLPEDRNEGASSSSRRIWP